MTNPAADPEDMLAGFRQQIEQKVKQAEQLQQAATEVRVSTASADGSVTVLVDHSGNMIDLTLTDGALRKRPDEVSKEILATVRSAQSKLTERMQEAMEPVVGADSETLGAVMSGFRERFPEPEEPEQSAPAPDRSNADEGNGNDSWMDDRSGW